MPNPISKIPFLGLPDSPILSTSQNFVPIADIKDDVVVTKEGGASIILESTSLNFSLLSEKEQQAVIFAYGALLNSLSFPIQIVVRSQIKDIKNYMEYLEKAQSKITNQKLLVAMKNYREFIEETVKKKNVLGKNFYIVLPFSPLELGVTKSAKAITRQKGPLPVTEEYIIKKAKITLYPKRDHLIRQAARLGIKLKQLATDELIEIFYRLFNAEPPTARKQE